MVEIRHARCWVALLVFLYSAWGMADEPTSNDTEIIQQCKEIAHTYYPQKRINGWPDRITRTLRVGHFVDGEWKWTALTCTIRMSGGYEVVAELKDSFDANNNHVEFQIVKRYCQKGSFKYDVEADTWRNGKGEAITTDLLGRVLDVPARLDSIQPGTRADGGRKAPKTRIDLNCIQDHIGESLELRTKNGRVYQNARLTRVDADRIVIELTLPSGRVTFTVKMDQILAIDH